MNQKKESFLGAEGLEITKRVKNVFALFHAIHDTCIHYRKCLLKNWSHFYISFCIEKLRFQRAVVCSPIFKYRGWSKTSEWQTTLNGRGQ